MNVRSLNANDESLAVCMSLFNREFDVGVSEPGIFDEILVNYSSIHSPRLSRLHLGGRLCRLHLGGTAIYMKQNVDLKFYLI